MNVSIDPTKAQDILGTASITHVLTTVNDKIINAMLLIGLMEFQIK